MLWIDDEIRAEDPSVILLRLEGIGVDCVGSGERGVAMALTNAHDGLILDSRLPDINGLTVLERLVLAHYSSPVMMLSGFPDVQVAVAALKFGAVDYRQKPLIGEELVSAVKALCGSAARIRQKSSNLTTKQAPIGVAARALTSQSLSALEFLILLRTFRRSHFRGLTARSEFTLKPAARPPSSSQIEALAAGLDLLAEDVRVGKLMCTNEFARLVNMPSEQVRALLARIVGSSFLECRLALRVAPTLPLLAFTFEQSAQIAFSARYEWAAQFNRDFHAVLGLTPIRFREVCRDCPN